jgi:hypothetical protein
MVKHASQTTPASDEGLPDIAEASRKKPALLILLGVLLLLLGTHFYFHFKTTKNKTKFLVEESYTVPNNEGEPSKSVPLKEKRVHSVETKQLSEQQLALLQAKQKELQQRLSAPIMLLNQSSNPLSSPTTAVKSQEKNVSSDPNSQFFQQLSTTDTNKTVQATRIGPLNQLIGEGQVIHAIDETGEHCKSNASRRAHDRRALTGEAGNASRRKVRGGRRTNRGLLSVA